MKSAILQMLRDSEGLPVSGNAMCARLGTSRVAVWKHIRKLQASGYGIEAGVQGYRLQSSPDALYPWEFPGREERIVYLPETPSTMDVARGMAREGCPAFTTVVAGRQTQGRGRMRRKWFSRVGGLYFTVVLRPRIPIPWSSRVNFLASLTLARILRERYAVDAGVKWPNDILVGGCKLCGLLSEMETEGEEVGFVNVGVGLNVNNDPPEVVPPAVSLRRLIGRAVPRRDILAAFLDAMEARVEAESWEGVIEEWKAVSATLDRPVRIETARETIEGRAVGVDENGALLVRTADGDVRTVVHGDCFQG
jgi:BirA family transcriptional regulator, biotin operon repressor / biotin---[acetyl-CoA-carboxylase] ligase